MKEKHTFKKLIVGGEMRSGTTFLGNFLNSQQGVEVYSDFLRSPIVEGRKLGITDIQKTLTEREKNVLVSNLVAESRLMNLPQYSNISRDEFESWDDLYTMALGMLSDSADEVQVAGIKVTREYHYYRQLLDAGYHIIYLYRDPRDVLLSAKNRFGDFNRYEYAMRWSESLKIAEQLKSNPLFFTVKFEDLIEHPDTEVRKLGEFLGLDLKVNLNALTQRKGVEYVDNSSFGDVSKTFDTRALFRWKQVTDSQEVYLVNGVLHDDLIKYNYEVADVGSGSCRVERRAYVKYILFQKIKKKIKKWFSIIAKI